MRNDTNWSKFSNFKLVRTEKKGMLIDLIIYDKEKRIIVNKTCHASINNNFSKEIQVDSF